MDIQTYLRRIRYEKSVQPNYETLRGLQRAHMLSVPFENLDIVPLHRPIQLKEESLWDKIVVRQRGGFCYELNGMFAWLLRKIGFDVTYLNGRVYRDDGSLGIDFDHLTLLVSALNQSERWLADVGFGDSFMEPLKFEANSDHAENQRAYKLEQANGGYVMWQRDYDDQWKHQYFFDLTPRKFPDDYLAGCSYHQNPKTSSFGRESLISLATSDGRVTLANNKLIVTKNDRREEIPVGEKEIPDILKQYFDTVL
ncbi:MAG: arylamine N-acetyltransferase [Chloroflexi bacterium]|nr:arylamine N-acetyltransferase [Chloroflexota bacterium]